MYHGPQQPSRADVANCLPYNVDIIRFDILPLPREGLYTFYVSISVPRLSGKDIFGTLRRNDDRSVILHAVLHELSDQAGSTYS